MKCLVTTKFILEFQNESFFIKANPYLEDEPDFVSMVMIFKGSNSNLSWLLLFKDSLDEFMKRIDKEYPWNS